MGQVGILELLQHGAGSFTFELFQCVEGAIVQFFVLHKSLIWIVSWSRSGIDDGIGDIAIGGD